MLGRSANNIFWMARYLERAENTARLLDAGFRMAMTRGADAAQDEWRSVLVTLRQDAAFLSREREINGPAVFNYILRGSDNPGSVLAMVEAARMNARAVRTCITREVWEATNQSWMELRTLLAKPVRERSIGVVLAAIKAAATQVRGAIDGTMLRNDSYNFARIGTFIERADNTARLLDVKYYVLLPSVAWVGSRLDNVQWETVLRSVSGDRAYRWLNGGALDARGIAQFLILDSRFPRSLRFCYDKIRGNMHGLSRQYGQETEGHHLLRAAGARLHQPSINPIFDEGLHEFIVDFLASNHRIAEAIATDYRFTN